MLDHQPTAYAKQRDATVVGAKVASREETLASELTRRLWQLREQIQVSADRAEGVAARMFGPEPPQDSAPSAPAPAAPGSMYEMDSAFGAIHEQLVRLSRALTRVEKIA